MTLLRVAAPVLLLCGVAEAASPTLDASNATAVATAHNSTGGSVNITTTSTNDVIVLFIGSESLVTTSITVSGLPSGAGLTWHRRGGLQATGCQSSGTCSIDGEIFWAFSSGTQSAQAITWNWAGTVDCGGAIAFGVHGTSGSVAPWDSNGGLTATNSKITAGNAQINVPSVSTSQADDLLLSFCTENSATCSGNATGWTLVPGGSWGNSSCTFASGGRAYSKSVSATQSAVSVDINGSLSNWVALVDALTSDAIGGGTSNFMLMGVGK